MRHFEINLPKKGKPVIAEIEPCKDCGEYVCLCGLLEDIKKLSEL